MLVIARTVAHLLQQLGDQGRDLGELELVRRAYDFGTPLHSARFEVDGTPFHVHGIGVASIAAQVGAPAAVIAAGVLHNVFVSGDWADGRGSGDFPQRRQRLRAGVGAEVATILSDHRRARANRHLGRAMADPASVTTDERWSVLLDLADFCDKWDDGRIYFGAPDRDDRRYVDAHRDELVALARALGWHELAGQLAAAFDRVGADEVPASLLLGRRHSEVVLPPSARARVSVALLGRARRVRWRLRRWRARVSGNRA